MDAEVEVPRTAFPPVPPVSRSIRPGPRVQSLGLRVVAAKVRRRLWSTRRSIAVVRQLDVERSLPDDGMWIEFVTADSFATLSELVETALGVEYLYVRPIERTRRARAGVLSVAHHGDGRLMAFHFIHETQDYEALERVAPQMYPRMKADEVLTEAVYCLPAFRGRAVAARLLQETGARLARIGKRRAWAYLDTTNVAALRMFNRAGYAPSGEERIDRYRLGRFSTDFRDLAPATRAEWEAVIAGARRDDF